MITGALRWEPWPEWDFLAEPPQEGEGPFCSPLCDCVRQEGLHERYWGQEGQLGTGLAGWAIGVWS